FIPVAHKIPNKAHRLAEVNHGQRARLVVASASKEVRYIKDIQRAFVLVIGERTGAGNCISSSCNPNLGEHGWRCAVLNVDESWQGDAGGAGASHERPPFRHAGGKQPGNRVVVSSIRTTRVERSRPSTTQPGSSCPPQPRTTTAPGSCT